MKPSSRKGSAVHWGSCPVVRLPRQTSVAVAGCPLPFEQYAAPDPSRKEYNRCSPGSHNRHPMISVRGEPTNTNCHFRGFKLLERLGTCQMRSSPNAPPLRSSSETNTPARGPKGHATTLCRYLCRRHRQSPFHRRRYKSASVRRSTGVHKTPKPGSWP